MAAVVETRYFVNATITVNTVTAYFLGLYEDLTGTAAYLEAVATVFVIGPSACGIKPYILHADGTRTSLSADQIVAQVTEAAGMPPTLLSATWDCPETALEPTDAILIEVWGNPSGAGWTKLGEFVTKRLGASKLNAVTWTVYYWISTPYKPAIIGYTAGIRFHFDGAYDSRIQNFTWTPVIVVKKIGGYGLTFFET